MGFEATPQSEWSGRWWLVNDWFTLAMHCCSLHYCSDVFNRKLDSWKALNTYAADEVMPASDRPSVIYAPIAVCNLRAMLDGLQRQILCLVWAVTMCEKNQCYVI